MSESIALPLMISAALLLLAVPATAAEPAGYYAMSGWCYSHEPAQITAAGPAEQIESSHVLIDCVHEGYVCTNHNCIYMEDDGSSICTVEADAPDILDPKVDSHASTISTANGVIEGYFITWAFDAVTSDGSCARGILGTGLEP